MDKSVAVIDDNVVDDDVVFLDVKLHSSGADIVTKSQQEHDILARCLG
jgi:hypothetical protein